MNRKQLGILILLALVLGAIGYFAYRQRDTNWKAADSGLGKKVFPEFPINDVAQIALDGPGEDLHLLVTNSAWRVQERWGYPADFSDVRDALRKMWELEAVRQVKVGASQLGRLNLLPPDSSQNAAIKVTFKDKDGKEIRKLFLGKEYVQDSEGSQFGGGASGRFIMSVDAGTNVWIVSDALSGFNTDPKEWLDKSFIKVEKIKSIAVTSTNEQQSFTLVRESESGPWSLANPRPDEELDSAKTSSFNYLLSSPSFVDVVNPAISEEETGMNQPVVAHIQTFDDLAYTVKVGSKTADDNYYVQVSVTGDLPKEREVPADEKPEDKEKADKEFADKLQKAKEKLDAEAKLQNWTYLVSKWTVDSLLKTRADLLAEKKADEPEEAKPTTDSLIPNPLQPVTSPDVPQNETEEVNEIAPPAVPPDSAPEGDVPEGTTAPATSEAPSAPGDSADPASQPENP